MCVGRWLVSVFGHTLPSAACPGWTAAGEGLWPQGLVYPGKSESLNTAAGGSTWILLVFYMCFHWWTCILSSQRQEQVGAVAAVLVRVASHTSVHMCGICVFCVCWAHISSLAATWIWGHGVAASPLLGLFPWREAAGLVRGFKCVFLPSTSNTFYGFFPFL